MNGYLNAYDTTRQEMARITWKDGPEEGIAVEVEPFLIGRGEDCQLRIADDYLALHQCRIVRRADRHAIENLGATPLVVNRQRVDAHVLSDGDVITLLDHRLVFWLSAPSPAAVDRAETPPVASGGSPTAPVDQQPCRGPAPVARLISSRDPSRFWKLGAKEVFIGRGEDCAVCLADDYLADRQCRVRDEHGRKVIENLGPNPLVVNGQRVDRHALCDLDEITISDHRFVFHLEGAEASTAKGVAAPSADRSVLSTTQDILRELAGSDREEIRRRSLLIVRAFEKAQQRQKRKYTLIVTAAGALAAVAVGFAIYYQLKIGRQRGLAEDIFYNMKSLELEIARLQHSLELSPEKLSGHRSRRLQMERSYERFTQELGIYAEELSEQDRLILKMARVFGECEINIPEGFVREVRRYIGEWQSSRRYRRSVERAVRQGYHLKIGRVMLEHDLPPQFFYLALVESDFKPRACGPETRYGIAKGMWQFIPMTARKYGLEVGPLQEYRRPDPRDERHDVDKATRAAAEYLRFIYDTEAQASGLLVMASYNWGEHRVRRLIRKMPENPRERNFWRLISDYADKVPDETYNYVYRILSAAVIGENPRLFGFDFDNPLAELKALANAEPNKP